MAPLYRRSILRLLAAATFAAAVAWGTAPAQAEIKGLEIIAPANPGSGYDQAARAMQQALEQEGLASGVQVVNIPGAGGTVGLAQFVSGKKRSPSILVTAFSMVGAIITNKVTGHARQCRSAGAARARVRHPDRAGQFRHQDDGGPRRQAEGRSRPGGLGPGLVGRRRPRPGRADHEGHRRRARQAQGRPLQRRRRAGGRGPGRPCHGRRRRRVGVRAADPGRPAPGDRRLLARAAEDRGRADAEGAGRRRGARDLARGDGASRRCAPPTRRRWPRRSRRW